MFTYFVYVLNHSLDAAHSLDGLSSERDKRRVYGPAHLLDSLSATWERSKISNDMIQFMRIEELRNLNFWSPVWDQKCNGKQVVGLENYVE